MTFNSWPFVLFIFPVLGVYYLLPHRAQNRWLLLASYVFYGAWDWRFLGLIWLSTGVDYLIGQGIHQATDKGRRKRLLCISLLSNLGLFGLFKYFNFFVDSASSFLTFIGLPAPHSSLQFILPIGISFYTFQTLSYTIDIYRGTLKPCRSFPDFALFVAFFPQLVAGPIERAKRLIPQIEQQRSVTGTQVAEGAWLVLWGFFKKLVIADNLARYVDPVYSSPGEAHLLLLLLATYAFAYQIYCDFSGYTDIARGLAKMMGFELMKNFDQPFLAASPAEFWRRWHISLSTWLRDYLYIPLGGNRGGIRIMYRNLFLTMLLGGLWHGAAWNFVIWGIFHGVLLILYRHFGDSSKRAEGGLSFRRVMAVVWMFHLTCVGWWLFRINGLADIAALGHMLPRGFIFDGDCAMLLFVVTAAACMIWPIEWWSSKSDDPRGRWGWNLVGGPVLVSVMLLAIVVLTPPSVGGFIYFQF